MTGVETAVLILLFVIAIPSIIITVLAYRDWNYLFFIRHESWQGFGIFFYNYPSPFLYRIHFLKYEIKRIRREAI